MARYGSITVNEKLLLTPSWVSGSIAVFAGTLAVGIPFLSTAYFSSAFKGVHLVHSMDFTAATNSVSHAITNNIYMSDAPIFIFWGLIGLASYFIVNAILEGYRTARNMTDEMGYFKADKKSLEEELAVHMLIRTAGLIIWWPVFHYLLYSLFPYATVAGRVSASHTKDIHDWERTILAALWVILLVHCLAILIRLIALRPRLFGAHEMVDD
ncbi:MAG TPA: hypothetical protein VGS28_02510 [Candidatus Saccharimonadales bacterium]|nr:hypothetical protein [Candidatus Saccharimonadales bacterium]